MLSYKSHIMALCVITSVLEARDGSFADVRGDCAILSANVDILYSMDIVSEEVNGA